MLKRTKGRLLITLLVVTGLAGTINNNSITPEERKYAVNLLKNSKNNLLDNITELSDKQLNYRSTTTEVSVRNCLSQAAMVEQKLWQMIDNAMEQPANPEKRKEIKISDHQLVELAETGKINTLSTNTFKQANTPWKTATEATTNFKAMRNGHIKHMKSSTEDLRNHVVLTPAGWLDCYQLILLISASTNHSATIIEGIKLDQGFPKK